MTGATPPETIGPMRHPNQHAARQADPASFTKTRPGVMDGAPDGVSAVYGSRDGSTWEVQSIRADSSKVGLEEFRSWLDGQGFSTQIRAALKAAESHPEGERYPGRYKGMGTSIKAAEDDEDEDKDKPFGGKKAPPFKAKLQDDDDAETEEEEREREKEEAKAAAKAKAKEAARKSGRGTGGGAGGGSRRYYSDEIIWGAPYTLTLADGAESWVEIVRSGKFYGSTGPQPRQVTLTPEAIDQLATNFQQVLAEGWFTGGCPVGYNHASAMGDRTPEATRAAARIKAVDVRPNKHGGVSLWGLFSWTPEGADRVRAGEFAAISAELIPPASATSKVTGEPLVGYALIGATLTNQPFIPGMTPPSLSDTVAAAEGLSPLFLSELEAPEMPTENQVPNVMEQLAEITGKPIPQLLAEVQRLQEKADRADALEDALTTATEKITTLAEQNGELADREKSRVLDEACAKGRIAPTDREHYWQTLQTVGTEVAHRWFSEGDIPVARSSAPPTAEDPSALAPQDAFVALMDRRVSEGLSESDAYAEAKLRFGGNLYTPAES